MTERGKISEITLLQSLACVLVVLGHSLPGELSDMPHPLLLMRDIVYSFHMPLFFSVSGYLYCASSRQTPYHEFMRKKAKRLLVPYLILSSLAFIPKVFLSRFALRPVHLTPGDFLHSLLYPQDNVIIFFWFLASLFLVFAVSPYIKKIMMRSAVSEILLLAFLFALKYIPVDIPILNLSGTMQHLVWFALGISLCRHGIPEKLSSPLVCVILMLLFSGIYFVQSYFAANEFTVNALILCGIASSWSLCFAVKKEAHVESTLGMHYYQIYLLSWFAQVPFRILFQLYPLNAYLVSCVMFCAGIVLPVAVSVIIGRFVKPLRPVIGL